MSALIRSSAATLLVVLFTASAIISNANAQTQIGGALGSIELSTTVPQFTNPPPLDPNGLKTTQVPNSAPAFTPPKAVAAQAAPAAAAAAAAAPAAAATK